MHFFFSFDSRSAVPHKVVRTHLVFSDFEVESEVESAFTN